MVSLHNFISIYLLNSNFSDLIIFIVNILFIFNLLLGFFLFSCKSWVSSTNKKNFATMYTYFSIILLMFLLLLKLYFSYLFENITQTYLLSAHSCSFFSDTLAILAVVVTVISWYYLSERFLFRSVFFILYFFVFVFCTVNMVYTNNLFVMFLFFEFIFVPSLFFVYKFGYSKRVEKTVSFLLLWTLSGSFIVLIAFSYLYSVCNSLELTNIIYVFFTPLEQNILCLVFFLGFGIKLPIWPFHYWLTKVHVEAPTGFSIFLSGFLVKTAFFCLAYVYIIFNTKFANTVCVSIALWSAIDTPTTNWIIIFIAADSFLYPY